jgi:hypothetical protein
MPARTRINAVFSIPSLAAIWSAVRNPMPRPSTDPVLMIQMLIIAYVFAIRSVTGHEQRRVLGFALDRLSQSQHCRAARAATTSD